MTMFNYKLKRFEQNQKRDYSIQSLSIMRKQCASTSQNNAEKLMSELGIRKGTKKKNERKKEII